MSESVQPGNVTEIFTVKGPWVLFTEFLGSKS